MNLTTTVSGLTAAQKGLSVTGHNLANVNTPGYTRQQLLQHETGYRDIKKYGGYTQQMGIGVSETEIRQIRDEFADEKYRLENSKLNFYQTQNKTIQEIETILDEPNGESLSKFLDTFWGQTQKLATNPSGLEERMSFLQNANVIIQKVNYIQSSLQDYQTNLNLQVVQMVNKINELVEQIDKLNDKIAVEELNGVDNANDYRDKRNNALDELSGYVDINYYEQPEGGLTVKINGSNGTALLENGFITTIDLKQTAPRSPFLNPIIRNTGADMFEITSTETTSIKNAINSANGNDGGALKALLLSRGPVPADSSTEWSDIAINDNQSVDLEGNYFIIPKLQKKLDVFTKEIVTMINESFSGYGVGSEKGLIGPPVFIPIFKGPNPPDMTKIAVDINNINEADIIQYNSEMEQYYIDIVDHLSALNIEVNPKLLAEGGSSCLGTVPKFIEVDDPDNPGSTILVKNNIGNIGSNENVQNLLNRWNSAIHWYQEDPTQPQEKCNPQIKYLNVADFYAALVIEIGQDGYIYSNKAIEKLEVVENVNNERWSMSAISQDEELSMMMKYQYAYNASARMLTVLDGMMDVVINKM
ncbi:MAG: flagellar hook-associated protein FlgK [Candidatus Epulonipiscioides saccharophilum]|nr:MAG: flagellar hook-associated protein FlgK [Epulopiscium sp. AS2M-Bin001]